MSGLLGGQLPMFAVAALVLVVAVIGAIFVVRRGGKRGRGEAGTRGRQGPRLAMIDLTPIIDGRKLVIVRRDDVEHLVLIGGATDVLIEANIRRSESVDTVPVHPRETAPRVAAEAPPRVAIAEARADAPEADEVTKEIPVPEAASWPLQPDAVQRLKRASDWRRTRPCGRQRRKRPPQNRFQFVLRSSSPCALSSRSRRHRWLPSRSRSSPPTYRWTILRSSRRRCSGRPRRITKYRLPVLPPPRPAVMTRISPTWRTASRQRCAGQSRLPPRALSRCDRSRAGRFSRPRQTSDLIRASISPAHRSGAGRNRALHPSHGLCRNRVAPPPNPASGPNRASRLSLG